MHTDEETDRGGPANKPLRGNPKSEIRNPKRFRIWNLGFGIFPTRASDGDGQVHQFAVLTAAATWLLIVVGGLVTSNEAGDSVPDWPLSFGQILPRENLVGNVVYEYGHRVVAATVGLLTIILNVKLWRHEPRRWVRYVGLAALMAVLGQGLLGGVRVLLLEYRIQAAVIHACLAQLFFGLVVSVAVFTSRQWIASPAGEKSEIQNSKSETVSDFGFGISPRRWGRIWNFPPRVLCAAATVSIFFQLVLGAAYRHGAVALWPHIVGAAVVTLLLGWAVIRLRHQAGHRPLAIGGKSDPPCGEIRNPKFQIRNRFGFRISDLEFPSQGDLVRLANIAAGLLLLQLILGVGAYLARLASVDDPQPLEPMVSLTVAHVAVGALVLAVTLTLWLFELRPLSPCGGQAKC